MRPRGAAGAGALPLAAVSAVGALAQNRLLDRAIRGRTWIGIVAFALIGIVALQLGLLKLNGGIGHALEREALLQRQNAALSIENSEMGAGPKVEALAAKRGMAFASTAQLRFLGARPNEDVAKAAAALAAATRTAAARASESARSTSSESSSSESSSVRSTEAGSGEASSGEATAASGEASSGESSSGGKASSAPSSEAESSSAAGAEASATSARAPASGGESEPSGGTQPTPGG